eukprot:12898659-Prorocentrum_lima.AAC.1
MPQMNTPPRMPTPGAISNVHGHLAFSPGMTTQCSPGNGSPAQPISSRTSRIETLNLAVI